MNVKATVKALLDRLPDNCTLEEVLYRLYVLSAIEKGRADAKAGKVISQEQVVDEMKRRWLLGADM